VTHDARTKEAQRAWKKAEARAVRAVAGAQRATRGLGRLALWVSILLFAVLYLVLVGIAYLYYDEVVRALGVSELELFSLWSVIAMNVLPLWTSLLVLVSCATVFPAERAAGTLEGLRLTPLPGRALARALMRPRLRFGLVVLLVGLPFYLLPRELPSVSGEWIEPPVVAHTVFISTLGRGYFFLRLDDYVSKTSTWISCALCGGLPAFIVDATRLYAMAAIGTAVSMRARSAARAVFWSLLWGLLFLAVTIGAERFGPLVMAATVGAERLGPLVVLSWGPRYVWAGCLALVVAVLVLEAGVGNLLVPRLILRAAARRAERWFAQAG